MNYVPLCIKTDYTLLSSLVKIDDLITKLSSLNIKTVAICDDNLFGTLEFYDKCIKNDIKPIIGLEIKLEYEILLYAKNYSGYQNLCSISNLKNNDMLNFNNLINYINDLMIIIPFKYKEHSFDFESYTKDVFIGYDNEADKKLIDGKKVYVKKVYSLEKEKERYLPFLYKIKGEEFTLEKEVTLDNEIDTEDKKSTIYFANFCNLTIPKRNDLLPVYNNTVNFDERKFLTDLCIVGLKKRLNNNVTEQYVKRLKHELNIIIEMGFCNYFLVVWDYVKFAKKNNILVGARGSAASSLVSYSLGITDIDPIKYDLLFERFLNPKRITMPDIDMDFDALKRDEVIKYVTEKYGSKNVCGIVTFSNLMAKQVIRDLGRIFEISDFKIDGLLRNFDDKKTLKEQLENINVKRILFNDDSLKKLYEIAVNLEGLKRHTSVHAAGIIISSKDLSRYIPLLLNSDGTLLCGYTMNYIEDVGLLKMDFLSLKNLTIVDKIIKNVDNLNFNKIPLDDKKTYELFCNGNLDGVFQFESIGMRRFIEELKPDSIDDLIAAVALFRPGPIDNIPHYIARKHGKEKIEYLTESLKPILESTYGIIIYQEQIMQIASVMAGFSYGEADVLRRAMSKKKQDVLIEQKEKFINGSKANGYDEIVASKVYDLILKFANYGFNKAHSVSYAILGYKIAYLKAHYPVLFMCEILNNYIGVTNKIKASINECKRLGIKIIKPSINTSGCEFKIKDGCLEYSLSMIKKIGTLTARQIVSEREENGSYKDFLDFVRRNHKLGKLVIKNLILAGCLDEFKETRRSLIENLDEALNYADLCADLDPKLVIKPEIKKYNEYDQQELTIQEQDLYGFYLSNHPTSMYLKDNSITTKKIDKYFDKMVQMVLYFENKREIETKNKDKMMFINASDSYGSIELIMFPKTYEKFFNIPFPGIYKISGKVEKRFSKLQIILYNVEKI